jgi:hypothetical protein
MRDETLRRHVDIYVVLTAMIMEGRAAEPP